MDLSWLKGLVDAVGLPLAVAFLTAWGVIRYIVPKLSGDAMVKRLGEALDVSNTKHFLQLRQDLERKIENESKATRKSIRNTLTVMMLDIEVWVQSKGLSRRAVEEENDE